MLKTSKIRPSLIILSLTFLFLTAIYVTITVREPAAASRVVIAGVPNLHKINENLYRSGQPTSEGMKNLESLGVKTVINLRESYSDEEEVQGTSLARIDIPMNDWYDVKEDEIVSFLKAVTDSSRQPILFHCRLGRDRAGMMCAIYRVAVDGWSTDDAFAEMVGGEFGKIKNPEERKKFLDGLDVEKIRQQAGIVTKILK